METDLPRLVSHDSAIENNLAVMARFCALHGVDIAPHAKTHLVRSLCDRQLAAGAWGLTVATTAQARQLREWGVPRILHANELVDAPAIAWVAAEFLGAGPVDAAGPAAEYLCYVDSPAGVALLERELAVAAPARRLPVLIEVGFEGGRTGVRDPADALQLARLVARSAWLSLAGVAGFEGLAPDAGIVERLLTGIRSLVERSAAEQLFDGVPIVTAGGSSYVDRVVAELGPDRFDVEVRTVLRSGCYITHDHGLYQRTSALSDDLRPALELEASVLSQPEPGLVIAGFGRRDAPTDDRMPVPLGIVPADRERGTPAAGTAGALSAGTLTPDTLASDSPTPDTLAPDTPAPDDWSVFAVNDHHAYLRVPAETRLAPGTVLRFGISHPCGAFDRWRAIPLLDADRQVIDVLRPAL